MKALLIKYPQNVSAYQSHRLTGGYKFIDTVKTFNEAWNIVKRREEPFIDDETLTMTDDSGRVVWESGDDTFDFGDYKYLVVELSGLEPDDFSNDANIYNAIKAANPYNMGEIECIVEQGVE